MRGDIKVVRKSIPYQRLYDQLKKVKFWSTILTCVAFILTFTSAFKRFQFTQTAIFYIILIILYCGIITLRVVSLCTKAPKKRIGGLIDDAFGTKILEKPLGDGYYSNGNVKKGIERMAANCFENCMFTDRISENMTSKLVVKNVILILSFVVVAFINMEAMTIATLFQLLISSIFIEELIRHLYFRHSIKEIFESFKLIYSTMPQNGENFQAQAIYNFVRYEKELSFYNQSSDSNIYQKLQPYLCKEWENIKIQYGIERAD